ncbi:MAG: DUF502 domain-containing protein [Paracoccaceae bacterium]
MQRLRGNFFAGIVLVGPVALTVYLAWTAITIIDESIVPWVPAVYNPGTYLGSDIPGFGVIVFLLFTTIVGWLTKNFFGRQIVRLGESWVSRMPVIRSIYNALKQIAETILSQSQSSFKNACLIEYPRKGLWAIGFVSTTTRGEIPDRAGAGELVSIFLPTTPNPTSGFLLFAPRADVVYLDMSVEEAAKLVISAGLVMPPSKAEIAAGFASRRSVRAA